MNLGVELFLSSRSQEHCCNLRNTQLTGWAVSRKELELRIEGCLALLSLCCRTSVANEVAAHRWGQQGQMAKVTLRNWILLLLLRQNSHVMLKSCSAKIKQEASVWSSATDAAIKTSGSGSRKPSPCRGTQEVSVRGTLSSGDCSERQRPWSK